MGVIKPPWTSQERFRRCLFNYCDHFGDKQRLATICKICQEELDYLGKCQKEGKNPYDMKNVFKEVGDNLAKVMVMVHQEAKRLGIDLDNLDDDYKEPPTAKKYQIYKLITKYADHVERIMNNLSEVPIDTDMEVLKKTMDVFSHSRHYIIAKIGRALSSRWYEEQDPEDDTEDSKTSALLAYVAIERNSRAALALSRHKPLRDLKQKHLKFAKLSLEVAQTIKEEFFPKENLAYREFGTKEYDQIFKN